MVGGQSNVVYAKGMSEEVPASEATKNSVEDTVNWFLADKLQDPVITIATKKYLTPDNVLVHLTHCNVAEISVPRIKVQVFNRVAGGVREESYQIFSDHRMTKSVNEMIFGKRAEAAVDIASQEVSEPEAGKLLELLNSLTKARQTL